MLLELAGIEKRFGGVAALRNGTLSVNVGEVHLLMGENGAGKSTLMKIVAGMLKPDGGVFRWKGEPVNFASPSEASAVGIAMVHQESLLAPHLTVAENIYLGREDGFFVSRRAVLAKASRLIEQHHFPLEAGWIVGRLSPAGKQLVEICRAIAQGSSLLIFDEPTSSLSDAETDEVFKIVRSLRERNLGVIYITHRLQELRSIGDRVTVLRDGETVHSGPMAELTTEGLIRHMVGRELAAQHQRDPLPLGQEVLRVEDLSVRPLLKNISLSIRAGEIVGLAGLIGAGRTELCRALFGVDRASHGRISVNGVEVRANSPGDSVRAGIALVPEDRQRTGLATARTIGENITLAGLERFCRFGFVDRGKESKAISDLTGRLRIKLNSPTQRARALSGGNQQKVVIAKWLARGATVFLFDEPTRGIDVGAKAEVFDVMQELARNGAAILMVSSELPELLQMADRILVMRRGEITGELARGATQEDVLRLAAFHDSREETIQ